MVETEKSWWFKNPTLVLIEKIISLNGSAHLAITELKEKIYKILWEKFKSAGCKVIRWRDDATEDPVYSPYAVIINPVFLGELPEEIEKILGEKEYEKATEVLREYLPEVEDPFAISIGQKVCEKLKISPKLHPNFINMVFIKDTIDFHSLPSKIKILLVRFFMAKLGAFKNIIVPYKDGEISNNKVLLGTLEGGHPTLSVEDLSERLMVLGSAKEVGGWEKINKIEIPKEKWINSDVVNGMIGLGKFLGSHKLLSSPVEIKDLLKNENLARLIIRIVNYSRQAEGAFMAFDPSLGIEDLNLPWKGIFVTTCSGRYGTVKFDLKYSDLAPVIPLKDGKVGVLKKEGEEILGPSVEAEEFIFPLYEMESTKNLKIRELDNGYILDDNGFSVPPIRAVVHLHRGYKIEKESEGFFEIPVDIKDYPPVGCGVDLMHEMSKYAMNKAVEMWENKGRKPYFALFYVPNHGTNIFIFWKGKHELISKDPFEILKELYR